MNQLERILDMHMKFVSVMTHTDGTIEWVLNSDEKR